MTEVLAEIFTYQHISKFTHMLQRTQASIIYISVSTPLLLALALREQQSLHMDNNKHMPLAGT